MGNPVYGSIFSERRPLPDTVLFNIIVWLEQNGHASLPQDRMRRLEINIIMREVHI